MCQFHAFEPTAFRPRNLELTHLSREQLQETVVYDAHQAVPRTFHHVHSKKFTGAFPPKSLNRFQAQMIQSETLT